VTSAIITIMANRAGERIPSSSPIFRKTSSINPRVFIKMPRATDSRGVNPLSLAARADPPSFPAMAVTTMTPATTHMCAPWISSR